MLRRLRGNSDSNSSQQEQSKHACQWRLCEDGGGSTAVTALG
jgi:hypothetical protein